MPLGLITFSPVKRKKEKRSAREKKEGRTEFGLCGDVETCVSLETFSPIS